MHLSNHRAWKRREGKGRRRSARIQQVKEQASLVNPNSMTSGIALDSMTQSPNDAIPASSTQAPTCQRGSRTPGRNSAAGRSLSRSQENNTEPPFLDVTCCATAAPLPKKKTSAQTQPRSRAPRRCPPKGTQPPVSLSLGLALKARPQLPLPPHAPNWA